MKETLNMYRWASKMVENDKLQSINCSRCMHACVHGSLASRNLYNFCYILLYMKTWVNLNTQITTYMHMREIRLRIQKPI